MLYLLIADIHANLEALNAVLQAAAKSRFSKIICLGDIVGYGANPNECCNIMRREHAACVLGNHDAAAAGVIGTEWFNQHAAACVEWTQRQLTEENFAFLKNLPKQFSTKINSDSILCVHGTPQDPILEYIDFSSALQALQTVKENLILVGHTHTPYVFSKQNELFLKENSKIAFSSKRLVVSLPSVGQPRDLNKKAGFALLDSERKTIEIKRVEYDIAAAAKKIIDAGLPEIEAKRLFLGR